MLPSTVLSVDADVTFVVDYGTGSGIAVAVAEIVSVAAALVVAVEIAMDVVFYVGICVAGAVEKHTLYRPWNLTVSHLLTSERQHLKVEKRSP